jgi:hypothetical protein
MGKRSTSPDPFKALRTEQSRAMIEHFMATELTAEFTHVDTMDVPNSYFCIVLMNHLRHTTHALFFWQGKAPDTWFLGLINEFPTAP